MLIVGMIDVAVLPPLVDRRRAERTFMRAAAVTAIVGPILLGLATLGAVAIPSLWSAQRFRSPGGPGAAAPS